MSAAAFEHSKESRRLCESCRDRRALFSHRGVVKADRGHTLCFECFRSERERRRAQLLAEVPPAADVALFGQARRQLTPREIEHRQRMLEHLRSAQGGSP